MLSYLAELTTKWLSKYHIIKLDQTVYDAYVSIITSNILKIIYYFEKILKCIVNIGPKCFETFSYDRERLFHFGHVYPLSDYRVESGLSPRVYEG